MRTINDPSISLAPIERIAFSYQKISRCDVTGEILSGGNTFVFVAYSHEAKAQMKKSVIETGEFEGVKVDFQPGKYEMDDKYFVMTGDCSLMKSFWSVDQAIEAARMFA